MRSTLSNYLQLLLRAGEIGIPSPEIRWITCNVNTPNSCVKFRRKNIIKMQDFQEPNVGLGS